MIELLLLAGALLTLTACGERQLPPEPEEPEEPGVTVLTYAILDPKSVDKGKLDKFNQTHKDIRIETKNYANRSEDGKQGADLLMVELATGQVPDIIDLGSDGQLCQLPYRSLAEKGYLEDLWPYIDSDPELGREGVVEALLKPAEVDGGLYVLYEAVKVSTLLGAGSAVGDRTSWSLEDMREAFAALPEGDVVLDNMTNEGIVPSMKRYLLTKILSGFIDEFVDFETNQCFFDSQQFRDILEFIHETPDTPEEYGWLAECNQNDYDDVLTTHSIRLKKQEAMLRAVDLNYLRALRYNEALFGERVVPVGYPLGEGVVGSYFAPSGNKLAMSSTCKDKEAAWTFMRELITYDRKASNGVTPNAGMNNGLPVNRSKYNKFSKTWFEANWHASIGTYQIPQEPGTKEGLDQVNAFVDSITHCSLYLEPSVLALIEEEAGAYFAGDLTLDQAVDRIQSRASLYVNESR